MKANTQLPDLSPGMWALLAAATVVQYGLLIWALVRLIKTDKGRLTLPFVAWLLIILLVNAIGPIAFLAVGRRPAPAPELPPEPVGESAAQRAVDTLYGDRHA